jgi:S-adenosylmethionine synthetase
MVGYACNETPELIPLETLLARKLNQYLYKKWPYDGKTQVTFKDGKVVTIVASFQNAPQIELLARVKHWLRNEPLAQPDAVDYHINPAGDWSIGGFEADAGLTGRKLIVDNYGPRVPIGGGAFSGKDPSKVDRSAAYMARKIAIDYLRVRKASEVFVYLAYAIGYDQPLEATVSIDGAQEEVVGYDLSPIGIVKYLKLKRPHYEQTAQYGHFGHPSFTWEN